MPRSSIQGVSRLRNKLRKLPDDITIEIKREVKASAEKLLNEMQSAAPHASIAENLSVKTARDGLTARIGLIGKRANRRGFLARILEFGAKPHVIRARGVSLTPSGRRRKGKGAKAMKIGDRFVKGEVRHPGLRPRPFFFKPFVRSRPGIIKRLHAAVLRALKRRQ